MARGGRGGAGRGALAEAPRAAPQSARRAAVGLLSVPVSRTPYRDTRSAPLFTVKRALPLQTSCLQCSIVRRLFRLFCVIRLPVQFDQCFVLSAVSVDGEYCVPLKRPVRCARLRRDLVRAVRPWRPRLAERSTPARRTSPPSPSRYRTMLRLSTKLGRHVVWHPQKFCRADPHQASSWRKV